MRACSKVVAACFLAAACSSPPVQAPPALPPLFTIPPPPPPRVTIAPATASKITFARIAKYPEPGWNVPRRLAHAPDGKLVTYLASESGDETMSLFAFDRATGKSDVLVRVKDLVGEEPATFSAEEELRRERQRDRNQGITAYEWAKNAPVMIIPHRGKVYVRDARGVRALVTTNDAVDPKACDTGERVAFVRKGELFAVDVATGKEIFSTRPATAIEGVTRGLSDFNAQEELGEPSGYAWSPRCDRILYLEVDERPVGTVPVLGFRNGAPDLMMQRYPRSGTKNPIVRAGIVDLATKRTTWLRLPGEGERYLGRFRWSEDGKSLFFQTLSRDQKRLVLMRVDPATGGATELASETSSAWISFSPMRHLAKSDAILFTSQATGNHHLELRSAKDGRVIRTLTLGPWDVESIAAVDEDRGRVVVSGTKESPLERHLYAVPLAGGEPTKLTKERGVHAAVFDRAGKTWIDVHSAANRSPRVAVMDERDAHVADLPARPDDEALDLRAPQPVQLPGPNGEMLQGALLTPRVITGRHPVVVMVYGGPGAQLVLDHWAPRLLWQHLADRGFVVFQLDNRGSGGQGAAFSHLVHRRLGKLELEDQIAGAKWLSSLPFVDASRIGIYGHSYGGFVAGLAMLEGGGVFKAGVAGSPVTDWRLYDTAYTERYMDTPEKNPEGYAASDLSKKAAGLTGKLFIVHAQMDENVHYQHTAQLVDALVAADKRFELLVLPSERHGYRTPATRAYVNERVASFLAESL
ncbi:MAG: S9 family peptidase [Labilithrix sp.]|nr:S9 family peptidase [Labilithrix sp.]